MSESDLDVLLRRAAPQLSPGRYVFVSRTRSDDALDPPRLAGCLMTFEETEGTTYIVDVSTAEAHRFAYEGVFSHIVLTVHSSLHAVGFTAQVSAALAASGIPANIVAAFHHDHVFVPEGRAGEAVRVLQILAGQEGPMPETRPSPEGR